MKKLGLSSVALLALCGISPAQAIVITPSTDASVLAGNILGSGISLVPGSLNYIGQPNQSGTFTDGIASGLPFDQGIVLSTGDVGQIPGPNTTGTGTPETVGLGDVSDDDVSTPLGSVGDADLDAIVAPSATQDAAVLEFNFIFGDDGSTGGDLFFNFVFASEEYVDFIGTDFNDVFGFFVDGTNIALVPGTSDIVSVNSINNSTNSAYYVNNVANTDGLANAMLDISFDGLTTVITASLTGLSAGPHSMKFAIADNTDGLLDSAVFIQAGTFSNEDPNTPPPTPLPLPGTLALLAAGLAGWRLQQQRKR